MRRNLLVMASALVLALPLSGCYHLKHTVGDGGSKTDREEDREWYILWGLVPLNKVDGGVLAGQPTDYTI